MQKLIFNKDKFKKDILAQDVLSYLDEKIANYEDSLCFYNEPEYPGNEIPTFTLFHRKLGAYIIRVYNYTNEMLESMNDNYWQINGKKVKNQVLSIEEYSYFLRTDLEKPINKLKNKLSFNTIAIFPYISSPNINKMKEFEDVKFLYNDYRTKDIFNDSGKELNDDEWKRLKSVVQKADILNSNESFLVDEPAENLRDAIALNNQKIAILDDEQLIASKTIIQGAERIRGLAGTGKTVILAMKAARIHKYNPEAKILFTFFTQSLYNHVIKLITKYFRRIEARDPNWEKLEVIHAWGGKTVGGGVYYNTCMRNGIRPLSFGDVRHLDSPFGNACEELCKHKISEHYDYVLIDEAQDMPLEFFKLIERVTKEPKQIIWAYDEFQTTTDVRIPDSSELFGENEKGPIVNLLNENDYILKKSYRNPLEILFVAFGFGFGFYSTRSLVQIIDDQETWNVLGFEVEGDLKPNEEVKIKRPIENSPNMISMYFDKYKTTNFNCSQNIGGEIEYAYNLIKDLILKEQVSPEDIMVIDMSTKPKEHLIELQGKLYSNDINSLIPSLVDGARDFLLPGNVTLTTVRRAKGNEVPIVIVLGSHRIYTVSNLYQQNILRNMLFIAITRAKGWLFISCSGDYSENFKMEYDKLVMTCPEYIFNYPNKELLTKISTVNLLFQNKEKAYEMQNDAAKLNEMSRMGDISKLAMFLDDETKKAILEALDKS